MPSRGGWELAVSGQRCPNPHLQRRRISPQPDVETRGWAASPLNGDVLRCMPPPTSLTERAAEQVVGDLLDALIGAVGTRPMRPR